MLARCLGDSLNLVVEMRSDIAALLKRSQVKVSPETFNLVRLSIENWRKLLESSESSPRMTSPFMILMDTYEVTLMLDDRDLAAIKPGLNDTKIEGDYRLLTFDLELELTITGFLAEVSRLMAEEEIPIMALSAFSRDHLLIKQDNLAKSLKTLGGYVDSVC